MQWRKRRQHRPCASSHVRPFWRRQQYGRGGVNHG
nr:MAG TPA: hypothetical protein [Bacteriophage sp.]